MSSAALRAKFDANVGGLEAGSAELAALIGSLGTQPDVEGVLSAAARTLTLTAPQRDR